MSYTNVPRVFRDDGITPVDAPEIFITEASDGRKILTATVRYRRGRRGERRGAAKDGAGGDFRLRLSGVFVRIKKRKKRSKDYQKRKRVRYSIKMMITSCEFQ